MKSRTTRFLGLLGHHFTPLLVQNRPKQGKTIESVFKSLLNSIVKLSTKTKVFKMQSSRSFKKNDAFMHINFFVRKTAPISKPFELGRCSFLQLPLFFELLPTNMVSSSFQRKNFQPISIF